MANLTAKQKKFCEEYVLDWHGTYAAIRAGASANSAAQVASRWLNMAKIKDYIAELQAKASSRTGVSLERTLQELARIAYADPANMYNAAGELIPISEMDADTRAAIVAVDQEEIKVGDMPLGRVKKVKLAPKEKALDMLMRYQGAYEKDNNQRRPVVIVDIMDEDEEDETTIPTSTDEDTF